MSKLEDLRRHKDEFFRTDPTSPLTEEQKRGFRGLRYFEEDPGLRFRLPLERDEDGEMVELTTNTGETERKRRAGVFRFQVEGQEVTLTAFGDPDRDRDLFIPFRDATSGEETYGAGRYLEATHLPNSDHWELDLNLAYNPYCAYNELWRCPFPPRENQLEVPIRAGERSFKPGEP